MLEKAIQWVKAHSIPGQGVVITSRQWECYPEVTGYYIPTLLSVGEKDLAATYAAWLRSVQRPDGAFGVKGSRIAYAFDTGQVIRGWTAMLSRDPSFEAPLRRACDWLLATADPATGRVLTPPPGREWALPGGRGEVNEGIHLYVLAPLRWAGEALGEKRYVDFVAKSLDYYLKNVNLTDFDQSNCLTHFFAYIQEALLDLGLEDWCRKGMAAVNRRQQRTGAVPGYYDAPWVCSTGLIQLAQVWYRLGDRESVQRAEGALQFAEQLKNSSGGFFGSYGVEADYFPDEEISWAVKYYIEAVQRQIAAHFDQTVGHYRGEIDTNDGRAKAIVAALGDLNGKRVLDAGCGKGRYCALLKRLYPNVSLVGMDISPAMLSHLPAGVERSLGGILNVPFASGEFDAVLCVEALEHVTQIVEGVRELARTLKPGGTLLIIDKNKENLGALRIERWEQWFDKDALTATMVAAGLETVADFIAYEDKTEPDGLFVRWTGRKPA